MNTHEAATLLLQELLARLPELEWKVSEVGAFISTKKIPKGLFRSSTDLNGSRCIAEIKMDIHALAQQKNATSAQYIADKIRRKIDVLVALCQLYNRKKPKTSEPSLGLSRLSTRQQWIVELEGKIALLEQQQKALLLTLEEKSRRAEAVDVLLQFRVELGELEKRLTLAHEMYQKAIS